LVQKDVALMGPTKYLGQEFTIGGAQQLQWMYFDVSLPAGQSKSKTFEKNGLL
jgi:hypothetical protein